jgi:hypothetical protein
VDLRQAYPIYQPGLSWQVKFLPDRSVDQVQKRMWLPVRAPHAPATTFTFFGIGSFLGKLDRVDEILDVDVNQ